MQGDFDATCSVQVGPDATTISVICKIALCLQSRHSAQARSCPPPPPLLPFLVALLCCCCPRPRCTWQINQSITQIAHTITRRYRSNLLPPFFRQQLSHQCIPPPSPTGRTAAQQQQRPLPLSKFRKRLALVPQVPPLSLPWPWGRRALPCRTRLQADPNRGSECDGHPTRPSDWPARAFSGLPRSLSLLGPLLQPYEVRGWEGEKGGRRVTSETGRFASRRYMGRATPSPRFYAHHCHCLLLLSIS